MSTANEKRPREETDKNGSSAKVSKIDHHRFVKLVEVHHGDKGRRQTMEDAHLSKGSDDLHREFESLPNSVRLSYYGIFDGHGGSNVAEFVEQTLYVEITKLFLKRIVEVGESDACKVSSVSSNIKAGFEKTEALVEEKCKTEGWTDGCCAVLVVIVNNTVHIANLGDSKAILCRKVKVEGKAKNAVKVSADKAVLRLTMPSYSQFPLQIGD